MKDDKIQSTGQQLVYIITFSVAEGIFGSQSDMPFNVDPQLIENSSKLSVLYISPLHDWRPNPIKTTENKSEIENVFYDTRKRQLLLS